MEQKFVKFEEAIEKLGISAERLNQLREEESSGLSRRLQLEVPQRRNRADGDGTFADPPPPSDISLVSADDLVDSSPLAGSTISTICNSPDGRRSFAGERARTRHRPRRHGHCRRERPRA